MKPSGSTAVLEDILARVVFAREALEDDNNGPFAADVLRDLEDELVIEIQRRRVA